MKKLICLLLALIMCLSLATGCSKSEETIIIYTAAADYRIAHMTGLLEEKFPEYNFIVEYQSTSKIAAKLLAEGTATECDIIHDLAYLSLDSLNEKGLLADLSEFDSSVFTDDVLVSKNYLPEVRTSGAIILNTQVMQSRNLPEPKSYEDLLKPEYKGLISMPDPKSSGTGYMFVKALVNAWGEEKAMDYFKKLSANVLQFTSSGSAPVNALVQQEVAIGLGMTTSAVVKINEGQPLKILYFEEGAPYSTYGQTIVKGKDERESVKAVFKYLIEEYTAESCRLYAQEKIFKDIDFKADNFPESIPFADMNNDTLAEKERLLEVWTNKIG